jgi:hypothetical protein
MGLVEGISIQMGREMVMGFPEETYRAVPGTTRD